MAEAGAVAVDRLQGTTQLRLAAKWPPDRALSWQSGRWGRFLVEPCRRKVPEVGLPCNCARKAPVFFRKFWQNCVSGGRVFCQIRHFWSNAFWSMTGGRPVLLWYLTGQTVGHITYATTVTSVRPLRTLETPLLQAGFSHRFLHKNRSSARQFRRSVKQHETTTQASWLIDQNISKYIDHQEWSDSINFN